MKHEYSADEIFELSVDSKAVFPLNLEFEIKDKKSPNIPGPGLYFLYFKDELVYIGFFYPDGDKRDARIERMKKEIATISMRGHGVVFSQDAFDAHQKCINYPIFQGEISQNGFQTSVNRVNFADKNWDDFKTSNFLCDFTFYWFPEEKNVGRTREDLEYLTNQSRKFYKPTCNG
jgi:hypothetical protein